MQFIKNGPDIPERLLQAHEEGRVVFFCGSGISYPAGLPGFGGLVDKIYSNLGESLSKIEKDAYKRDQYDSVIGHLEGRLVDGRRLVRQEIARILTPDYSKASAKKVHEALLILAHDRKSRFRLITTNFDRIFEDLIADQQLDKQTYRDSAPRLPVPKNRWGSLVYLHGLMPATTTEGDLDSLVISSGDFGLAYLTERWAAQFVSELFHRYVVCFVGYSINDPVLRYMMDALAADRLLGEASPEAFAFGSYSQGKAEQTVNEWNAKNVTPILYRMHSNHYYLRRTLEEWSKTYRDGATGKEQIVVKHASFVPQASTVDDDFSGRMLWALSDESGIPAKIFAEIDPAPPFEWLNLFMQKNFLHEDLLRFGVQPNQKEDDNLCFSLLERPTPYTRSPKMALVRHPGIDMLNLDAVMFQIARWLAKYCDDPNLILWIAQNGGRLHPEFKNILNESLQNTSLSPELHTLWRIVFADLISDHHWDDDLYTWYKKFKRHGLKLPIRLELRKLLSPRVSLRRPVPLWNDDEDKVDTLAIKQILDWEIVLRAEYVHSALQKFAQDDAWKQVLPDLLHDSTNLLLDVLDLMQSLDGADSKHDMSYIYQPSIEDHPQNNDYHDWTALIKLTRDTWVALAASDPDLARMEVERWLTLPYPVFRRLAFFAATYSDLITAHRSLNWLVSGDNWWLWSVTAQRESLRLLVKIAPELDKELWDILEQEILQGPPRDMFKSNLTDIEFKSISYHAIWIRLAKCKDGGATLGLAGEEAFQDLS